MLLYFTGDGLCSLEQVVDIDLYFRGCCPYFHFFLPFGDLVATFLQGGCFLGGDFSFFCVWSGGGSFLPEGDLFSFSPGGGGGSPLVGEGLFGRAVCPAGHKW